MDIFEPIREMLMAMSKEEQPKDSLEKSCGIISSSYPPNELYPDGYRIEYPFVINPKDAERYFKNS